MKNMRIALVVVIIAATCMAIGYLIFQGREIEKYAMTAPYGDECFLLYSSEPSLQGDNKNIGDMLNYCEETLSNAGYKAINLGYVKKNDAAFRERLTNNTKGNKKYILVDINIDNMVVSRNKILIRLDNHDKSKFSNNLEFANNIKRGMTEKNIQTDIYATTNESFNQDLGERAVKIEMSNKNKPDAVKKIVSNLIETLIK